MTVVSDMVVSFSLTCTASSVYSTGSCYDAVGSTTAQWLSDNQGTSAWIRVQMSGLKHITKLEIKSRCTNNDYNMVHTVDMEFDDLSTQTVITVKVSTGA